MNSQKFTFTVDPTTGSLREEDARKYFSTFGWFCFLFCLAMFVAREIIVSAVYIYLPELYSHFLFNELFSIVLLYAIALPVALPMLKNLPRVAPLKEKIKPSFIIKGFFIAYLLMYIGNVVSTYLMQLIQMAGGAELENPVAESVNSAPLWATVIFTVILAPILEEIVFRGILCRRLLALGEGFAIVLSAAFFALLHGNFYQLFYAFLLGCFFAFVYIKTGRLIYSVLMHVFINFMGTVVTTLINNHVRLDELMELILSETYVEAITNGNIAILQPYFTDIIILAIYSVVIYGLLICGIVFAVTNIKKIKLETGVLPPPKKSRANIIFLNGGIAAAIIILVLMMLLPLIL